MEIDCIDSTAKEIHQTAADHGFWDHERNMGEMLMLMTSELAEALEEDRDGHAVVWFRHHPECHGVHEFPMRVNIPGQPICDPKPEGAAVELIDCIIRCFDTAQFLLEDNLFSVGEVMAMKMAYNERRQHMHGKAY